MGIETLFSVQNGIYLQQNYNTPVEHTQAIPLAHGERNPFTACW